MAGIAEEYRRRIALALSFIGITLILIGLFVGVRHQQAVARTRLPATQPAEFDARDRAEMVQAVLFWTVVLIIVFGVSTLALMRFSRGFRKYLLHRPAHPTPADDVWAMHRLPDELPPDQGSSSSSSPGGD